MVKETKDTFFKMRMTKEEKEYLKEYAEAHDMTLSDLIRMALDRVIYLGE